MVRIAQRWLYQRGKELDYMQVLLIHGAQLMVTVCESPPAFVTLLSIQCTTSDTWHGQAWIKENDLGSAPMWYCVPGSSMLDYLQCFKTIVHSDQQPERIFESHSNVVD